MTSTDKVHQSSTSSARGFSMANLLAYEFLYALQTGNARTGQVSTFWINNIMTITRTPKVCKIMAFMATIRGLGLLFYILLGFRYDY